MGDSSRELEEKLGRLAPAGLSERCEARLHRQVEELAEGVDVGARSWSWSKAAGAAAALALLGALLMIAYSGSGDPEDNVLAGAGAPGSSLEVPEIEVVEHYREVEESPEDRGIFLTDNNEPMHSWGYSVKKIELVYDPESDTYIYLVTDLREEVLTEVTSF